MVKEAKENDEQGASGIYRSRSNIPSGLSTVGLLKVPQEQILRVIHLHNICKQLQAQRRNVSKYAVFKDALEIRVFESFDIQLCKVPKTGCTFISQVFKMIHDGVYNVFELSRKFAHSNQRLLDKSSSTFKSLPTVLMARNPYSRLYSAYIDRVFLPPRAHHFDSIRKEIHGPIEWCERSPTFLQFLRYTIDHVQRKHALDIHWRPIISLCNPCLTKNIMIIKHESFDKDVDNLLEFLNASSEAKEKIREKMNGTRGKMAVPGLIESQWIATSKKNGPKQCLTKHEIAEFLWKSFQSQGYIRSNSTFPVNTFKAFKTLILELCVKLFMAEIGNNGPTLEESKAQRRRYLVEAYKDIPRDVLNEIQAIYRDDFLLFDYDFDPPLE